MTTRPKANSKPSSDGAEDEKPAAKEEPKQDVTTNHARTVLEQNRADLVNRVENLRGAAQNHVDTAKQNSADADVAQRQLDELDAALKVLQDNA